MRICNIIAMVVTFLSLVSGRASAQTPDKLVQEIRTEAAGACVTVTYTLSAVIDNVKIEDEGSVMAQDGDWCLKGRDIHVYTNTDGTWILSLFSNEAIVEPKWTYDDLEAFYRTLLSASADNDVSVKVVSKTISERKPVSCFVPEIGDDWVVTDLR